jgi:hypothetical protein
MRIEARSDQGHTFELAALASAADHALVNAVPVSSPPITVLSSWAQTSISHAISLSR